MRIGSLVQHFYGKEHIGVVVGYWTHDISREEHLLVCWLTGMHKGDTDALLECDLEVLCE